MRRKSFQKMHCPIARSLERVGEWWSMLILRDALHGYTRFEEFRESLGVAPNILTTRLAKLVDSGFLERRQYNDKPPRFEYVPTARGRDFRPVLLSLMAFGNRHFAEQHRAEIAPALRRHVFIARRMFTVPPLLEEAGLDQRHKPRGQDIRCDAKAFAEFLEPRVAVQRVAQDQNAPPLADPLQRAGDRAVHLLEAFPAHGQT